MADKEPLRDSSVPLAKPGPVYEKKVLRDIFCYPSLGRSSRGWWGGSPLPKSKKSILLARVSKSGTETKLSSQSELSHSRPGERLARKLFGFYLLRGFVGESVE